MPENIGTRFAQTFSLWRDLESVYAYVYAGQHGEGLRQRHHWFLKEPHPGYVCLWVSEDRQPDTAEAVDRLERLYGAGPSADAFDFRRSFGPDGQPVSLRRDRARGHVEHDRPMSAD